MLGQCVPRGCWEGRVLGARSLAAERRTGHAGRRDRPDRPFTPRPRLSRFLSSRRVSLDPPSYFLCGRHLFVRAKCPARRPPLADSRKPSISTRCATLCRNAACAWQPSHRPPAARGCHAVTAFESRVRVGRVGKGKRKREAGSCHGIMHGSRHTAGSAPDERQPWQPLGCINELCTSAHPRVSVELSLAP